MTASLCLEDVLTVITQGLIDELGAAFARIWLTGPGDLCKDCFKADLCSNPSSCLHLSASSGLSTQLDGEHRRIPLGALKIGHIAASGRPVCTNDAPNDERISNKSWLRENGLCSFAGYPLIFKDERLGVLAMFSRRMIREDEFDRLGTFALQAAIAVKNAQLHEEVERMKARLNAENVYLQEEIESDYEWSDIIGGSHGMKKALDLVLQVAPTNSCVLIEGETGTGKELIARAVHKRSDRKDRAFVKLNCAAIPTGLLESELFGHEKGAFTGAIAQKVGRFELAHQGTIFLDEVGEIPLEQQSKLLRVLQEKEFERLGGTRTIRIDCRLIAATNRNLEEMVADREFRSDLYYRLKVFPIVLPALRERLEDIPMLVRYFVQRYARDMKKPITHIPSETIAAICRYPWPGNVRELENFIERCVILSRDQTLRVPVGELTALGTPSRSMPTLAESQREHILQALQESNWVIGGASGAAAKLGMKRTTLQSKIQKLGLFRPG
jgi:formate hydrogenlyase transcriptional activator